MSNRLSLCLIMGALAAGLPACADTKPADEPVKTEAKPAAPEGPYYDVTKDDITSHADFTSRNLKVMGIKLGDKTTEVADKNLGAQIGQTNVLTDEYQSYYQKNGIAIYTFRMTGKITKIELLQSFSDKIADAKLKELLANGDLKLMRTIFGVEEGTVEKPDVMGTEYIYDAKGIRLIKYKNGIVGLRFSELKK